MRNPLSEEHQVMRQSLLPGLIQALKYNRDRSIKDVWLFELGYAYFKLTGTPKASKQKNPCPADEKQTLGGAMVGNPQLTLWQTTETQTDFYTAKGALQNLFMSLAIPPDHIKYIGAEPASKDSWLLHPGQKARIVFDNTTTLGWLGQLHPQHAQNWDLDPLTYLFELDVETLEQIRTKPTFTAIPTQPPVWRDLTVDVPEHTENIAVIGCIKEAAKYLKDLDLVSLFPLNNGLKSLSYRLVFQNEAETFKSEEIEQIMNNIRKQLKEKLSASFRG